MYPLIALSYPWISARVRSLYRTGLRTIWVTSVRRHRKTDDAARCTSATADGHSRAAPHRSGTRRRGEAALLGHAVLSKLNWCCTVGIHQDLRYPAITSAPSCPDRSRYASSMGAAQRFHWSRSSFVSSTMVMPFFAARAWASLSICSARACNLLSASRPASSRTRL